MGQISAAPMYCPPRSASSRQAAGQEAWQRLPAHDTQLDRSVAPRSSARRRPTRRCWRALHEARRRPRPCTPKHLPLHDVGEVDSMPISRWLHEANRSGVCREPSMLPRQSCRVGSQTSPSLRAPQRGINHRDLKPANTKNDGAGADLMDSAWLRARAQRRRRLPRKDRDGQPATATGQVQGQLDAMGPASDV